MQVVEIVGDDQADEGQVTERRFAGPVAQQARHPAQLIAPAAGRRQDIVGIAQHAGDMHRLLLLAERPQVSAVAQEAAHQLDRGEGLADRGIEALGAAPAFQQIAAARHPQPVAEVEAEDHLEAGQQLLLDEAAEIDQCTAHRQAVMDIAADDELALRRAFIGKSDLGSPGRGLGREGHQLFSATPSLPIARGAVWVGCADSRVSPSRAAKSAKA